MEGVERFPCRKGKVKRLSADYMEAVKAAMGISFGIALFPLSSMFVNFVSSYPSWLEIALFDPGAYSGMAGCLVLVLLLSPWAACLGQLADRSLEQASGAYPVDTAGFSPWFLGPRGLGYWHPCLWTDGTLKPYTSAGFGVAVAVGYLPAPELALQGAIWECLRSVVMPGWKGVEHLYRSQALFRRCSVPSFGERSWQYRLIGLAIKGR